MPVLIWDCDVGWFPRSLIPFLCSLRFSYRRFTSYARISHTGPIGYNMVGGDRMESNGLFPLCFDLSLLRYKLFPRRCDRFTVSPDLSLWTLTCLLSALACIPLGPGQFSLWFYLCSPGLLHVSHGVCFACANLWALTWELHRPVSFPMWPVTSGFWPVPLVTDLWCVSSELWGVSVVFG